MKTLALIALAVFALESPGPEMQSLLKAEEQFSKAWMERGAKEAFSSYMAEDVTLLAAGAHLITGRESALAHIAGEPAIAPSKWHTLRADVSSGGDMGYTAGAYEFTATGEQKSGQAVYLFVWKKLSGAWKLAGVLRNLSPKPQAVTARLSRAGGSGAKKAASLKPGDVEAAKAAIIKADTDFSNLSVATNAPEAFGKYIADDGTMLGAITQDVKGRKAVQSQFPPSPAERVLVWRPVKADMSQSGDIGYTIGLAETKTKDEAGKAVSRHGKYLTVWKKQAGGSWKFAIDGGNSTPRPNDHQ